MREKVLSPHDDNHCTRNLLFIKQIVKSNIEYILNFRSALKSNDDKTQILKRPMKPRIRNKRGSLLIPAAIGGTFAGTSAALLTKLLPSDQLRAEADRTDRMLETMEKKTSALDINIRRLSITVSRIQEQINDVVSKTIHRGDLSAIQIQINSLLINLGDHLSYLYHLLTGSKSSYPYEIALDNRERNFLAEKLNSKAKIVNELSLRTAIRYYFQPLTNPDNPEFPDICVILDIPMQPPLKTISSVIAHPFPYYTNNSLWTPPTRNLKFLILSGGYYVPLDDITFNNCQENTVCSGVIPAQSSDDTGNCILSQFFHQGTEMKCQISKIQDRRFLLFTGRHLFFSLIKSIPLTITCARAERNHIETIKGRGVFEIPQGCTLGNKMIIFPPMKNDKTFLALNTSIDENLTPQFIPDVKTKFQSLKTNFINEKRFKANYTLQPNFLMVAAPWLLFLIATTILIVTLIIMKFKRPMRLPAIV